ncbi:hypothetical protein SEA_ZION_3 [Corynebacterium phage Zion]|uniref:Uncharacterized protein n=3 Tax=Corynebacterium virus Zion TaxID=2560397 RepID=A0A2H4P8X1_9CAUD|nr:flavodoxin [Corynebacterium phage Zion]ATW58677.1 hypothetical protein SEA_POTATOCHIP_3 [Corynebacterium phage PotatoChip]ATW58785.1 hypothetical protein SEA_ZION_3 [Corynebacterium phage Zion]AYR03342.1 hypothetical protein PETEYPAB_3 [Corynebacterium phage PeteyPab]
MQIESSHNKKEREMKTLNIVYYSHLGNTGKFVRNHLAPAIVDKKFPVVLYQIISSGPHQPAIKGPLFYRRNKDDNEFLLVFPCYGRNNTETHEVEEMVPLPMRDFIKSVEDQGLGRIIGGVVCGNRTFGSYFGNVKGQFDYPVLGRVELAGSRTEAEEIVSKLCHPALALY